MNVRPLLAWLGTLLVMALPGLAQTGEGGLSLEQAIELALENDPSVAAAAARLRGAAADRELAESARLFRLDIEAGAQSTDNPVLVFGQKLLQGEFTSDDFALESLNHPRTHEDFTARVVARQPLWVGGRIKHSLDAAGHGERGHYAAQEAARQHVVRSITDIYTGTTIALERVKVAEQALETAKAHVDLARSLFEGGLVVESDQLLAEVRMSEIEESLLRARSRAEINKAALNLAIGRSAGEPLELTSVEHSRKDSADRPGSDLESLVVRALEKRPDLLALRSFHSASLAGVERTNSLTRPSLGLEAGLETHDPDFFSTSNSHATVMLGFRWSLFNGGEKKAAKEKAEAETLEALAAVEGLEDRVELDVRSAFFDRNTARQRVELSEKGVALARRSLEIVEDRYQNGITTLVDLLDAQSAVTDSSVRLLEAKRDSQLADVALLLATGDL